MHASDLDAAVEAVMNASSSESTPPVTSVTRYDASPEVLFSIDVDAGYWMGPPILDAAEPFLIRDRRHPAFQAAGHRREGLCLIAGPHAARGRAPDPVPARNLAPTLIYLAGGDIPEGLDGSVHSDAIDAGHLLAETPRARPMQTEREPVEPHASAGGAEAVERRLRDLGYLE